MNDNPASMLTSVAACGLLAGLGIAGRSGLVRMGLALFPKNGATSTSMLFNSPVSVDVSAVASNPGGAAEGIPASVAGGSVSGIGAGFVVSLVVDSALIGGSDCTGGF